MNRLQLIKSQNIATSQLYDNISNIAAKFTYMGLGIFGSSFMIVFCFKLMANSLISKIRLLYFERLLNQEQGFFDQRNPYEYSTKIQTQVKAIESGVKLILT